MAAILSVHLLIFNSSPLSPWCRIYASLNWTSIGSDNGLSPGLCQTIILTNTGILLIGPLGTNFSEILIEIYTFSFKNLHLKMSGNWRPFCLGLNVLRYYVLVWVHVPESFLIHIDIS